MTKLKTMDETYGDSSDHLCCDKCGMCITCGDCKCKKSKSREAYKKGKEAIKRLRERDC